MKTITFPVGYRTNYLKEFLDCLGRQDLDGYEIICSAENSPACIDMLMNCGIEMQILKKPNSSGSNSHSGARDNMFNVLNHAFNVLKTDFNLHLEDDFLLSPDTTSLANWYYNKFKDKPLSYMTYGMFGFGPEGEDYASVEEVPFFEGLGWCAFKENWDICYSKCWYDDTLARKYFNAYGWDWAVQGFYREHKCKALRPLINRTQHNGRVGGTCCTVAHHDKHYIPLKWNQTENIKEFKIVGQSDDTETWIK